MIQKHLVPYYVKCLDANDKLIERLFLMTEYLPYIPKQMTKKYKLLKDLPNVKAGSIIEHDYDGGNYNYNNYPEWFEEIKEGAGEKHNWVKLDSEEILKMFNRNKNIFSSAKGEYKWTELEIPKFESTEKFENFIDNLVGKMFKEDKKTVEDKPKGDTQWIKILNNHQISLYSIEESLKHGRIIFSTKRASDGEIFSVGDTIYTKSYFTDKDSNKIKSIYTENERLKMEISGLKREVEELETCTGHTKIKADQKYTESDMKQAYTSGQSTQLFKWDAFSHLIKRLGKSIRH